MHESNFSAVDVEFQGGLLQFDCDDVIRGGLEFRARGNDVIAVSQHTKKCVEKEGMANFAPITPVVAQLYIGCNHAYTNLPLLQPDLCL